MRLCRLKLTRLRLKRRHVGYVTVTDSTLRDILAISPHLAELHIVDKTENVPRLVRDRPSGSTLLTVGGRGVSGWQWRGKRGVWFHSPHSCSLPGSVLLLKPYEDLSG